MRIGTWMDAPPSGAHVAVRIISEPIPPGLRERQDDIRALMTAVDGFYTFGVIGTEGGGGVSFIAGKDKATTDELVSRIREWVQAQYSDVPLRTPQVIEGEGLYRFVAQAAPT
jgi:hypothetical protein